MKNIELQVCYFPGQPKLGPYLRYEWFLVGKRYSLWDKKEIRRVYYEED